MIVDACPNREWRLSFGLARLGGLRGPSETHILGWTDIVACIDWERARMSVYSPKTERYEKHRRRTVPVTPKLMRLLQDSFDAAEPGHEQAVRLSRNNLHGNMHAILKRAGTEPFEPYFQGLRQSCETEWSEKLPAHVTAAWLGHSEAAARKHYLTVTDSMCDGAAGLSDSPLSPIAAESATAGSRTESQGFASGQETGKRHLAKLVFF